MRIKSTSFEPNRMREALEKLKDLERNIRHDYPHEKVEPSEKKVPPLWIRWWSWLFGT